MGKTSIKTGSETLMQIMEQMNSDSMSMTMSGDPDHDFAMMVRRHHEGAINMSCIQIEQGKDAGLKSLAEKIIKEQKKDNEMFSAFLTTHQPQQTSAFSEKAMAIMKEASKKKMQMTGDADTDFAAMMIQHHNDGIKMAKEYLNYGKAPQVVEIAGKNIRSQSEEIEKFNDWLERNTIALNKQ